MAAGETTVLTGATGFVGSMVLERLIADGAPVTVLIRAADDAAARRRLEELALRTWGEEAVVAPVEVLAADLECDLLGLAPDVYDALAERAAAVVHCAASVRFDLPLDEAQKINVAGTERVVALCERARAFGARRQARPPLDRLRPWSDDRARARGRTTRRRRGSATPTR